MMNNYPITKYENINRTNIPSYLFCFLQFVQIFMLYSLATENIGLERFCSYVIFGTGFIIYLVSFLLKGHIKTRELLLIVFVLYFYISIFVLNGNRDTFISASQFVLMLTIWSSAKEIKLNEFSLKIISFTVFIQASLLIWLYFSPYAYEAYTEYTDISLELTLGFDNPNQTGIIIYSIVGIMMILRKLHIAKIFKYLFFIEIVILVYLLYLTNARMSILSMIFILAYYFIINNKHRVVKKHNILIFLIFISSLLFVFVYLYMYENNIMIDLEIFGKKLFSGREELFKSTLDNWDNILFGNVNLFNFTNSHNAMLSILVNTGVIGMVSYILYTFINIKDIYHKFCLDVSSIGFIIIMSIFINAWAETACLVGGTIYYINLLTVCALNTKESEGILE